MNYTEPKMEIIMIEMADIICVSKLNEFEQGDGNSGSIGDWL